MAFCKILYLVFLFLTFHNGTAFGVDDDDFGATSSSAYWNLFKMFSDPGCTIHFSIRLNQSWTGLHSNFLQFCIDPERNCIFLQTSTLQQIGKNISLNWNPSLEDWQESGYENWTPIRHILAIQRYRVICLVQLGATVSTPTPTPHKSSNLVSFIPDQGWWKTYLQTFHRYPDYLILQLPMSKGLRLRVPSDIPWKIIVMDDEAGPSGPPRLLVGCNTCDLTENKEQLLELEWSPCEWYPIDDFLRRPCAMVNLNLIPFTSMPSSLEEINSRWEHYHSFRHNIGVARRLHRTNLNFYQGLGRGSPDSTMQYILSAHYNCSYMNHLCAVLWREILGSKRFIQVQALHVPHGAQVFGMKYCLVGRMGRVGGFSPEGFLALLQPFQWRVWSWLCLSVAAIWGILKLEERRRNKEQSMSILLWLFRTSLEQCDDGSWLRSGATWHLVIVWLFGVILIRNFYTSTIYSDITKEPAPSFLPSSFANLFETAGEHKFQILIASESYKTRYLKGIGEHFEEGLRSHAKPLFWIGGGHSGHHTSNFYNLTESGKIRSYAKAQFDSNGLEMETSTGVDLRQGFALTFQKMEGELNSADHFLCPLVGVFSGRTVYENAEPLQGQRMLAFAHYFHTFFTQFAIRFLKGMVESGVFGRIVRVHDILKLRGIVRQLFWTRYSRDNPKLALNNFTFADLVVGGGRSRDIREGSDDPKLGHHQERKYVLWGESETEFKATEVSETVVVWLMLLAMLSIAFGAFLFEISWHQFQSYEKKFNFLN